MGLGKLKKIIGIPIRVRPIIDIQQYEGIDKSYSGGSLYNKNTIFVSNFIKNVTNSFNEIIKTEGIHAISYYDNNDVIDGSDIKRLSGELLGPMTNIVNIFIVKSNDEQEVYKIYNSIQNEVSYLVENDIQGSISTALVYDSALPVATKSAVQGLRGLIEGLGTRLPNHGIVSNGVIAEKNTPVEMVINTLLYFNGKYGCVLDGEIMELKE